MAAYAGGTWDIPGPGIGPNLASPGPQGDRWHHVLAVTEHDVSTRLWVNGHLVATGDPPTLDDMGNGNPIDADLFIGANPQTGIQNREWWGDIDDVALWDRALLPWEIQQIYSDGIQGIPLSHCDPTTAGDLNRDGAVNFADFVTLSSNFGRSILDHSQGDANCDGVVDFSDFLVLAGNYGAAPLPAADASVPEPTGLMILGMAILFRRRGRRANAQSSRGNR